MRDLLEKELAAHGISILPQGIVEIESLGKMPIRKAMPLYKDKAKKAYDIVSKLWNELASTLSVDSKSQSQPPEGIENIFVYALQGLKRMLRLYPVLSNLEKIENSLCKALNSDTNSFSYKIMSKIVEYKLAIEWVGHILAKNLYIRSLLREIYLLKTQKTETTARGTSGPWSNLDLPMQERVFEWSDIGEEVAGRDRDIKNQRRYKAGLEGYNDSSINEGQVWRELKNEPFLWGKEGENPYPHRNSLWS